MVTLWNLITGGIAGLIAGWISHHFGAKRDLQRIREEFDHRLREQQDKQSISVEDDAWRKLQDALDAGDRMYASMRGNPLDLDQMNSEELEAYFKTSSLTAFDQDQIRRATHKKDTLVEIIRWKEMVEANTKAFDLRDYIRREKLYLDTEIADDFFKCAKHLVDAGIDYNAWRQAGATGHPEPTFRKEGAQSLAEARKLSLVIEAKIKQRRAGPRVERAGRGRSAGR